MQPIVQNVLIPHNRDAEQSVLCLEMLDPTGYWIPIVDEIAPVEDFYHDVHQHVQRAILSVHSRDGVASLLTVTEELKRMDLFNYCGGDEALDDIYRKVYFGPQAAAHADIIARCAAKRRMVNAAEELLRRGYDPTETVEEAYDVFSKSLNDLGEMIAKRGNTPLTMREHMLSIVDDIQQGRKPTKFIMIPEVDRMTGGAGVGEMWVLGALTSMGKTLCMMQMTHTAADNDEPVLIISNEMPGKSLASRLMRKASLMPEDHYESNTAQLRIDIEKFYGTKAPIIVAEFCSTIAEVERAIERAVREHKISVVALDYCQLVSGTGQTREQQVGDVSRRFKRCLTRHKLIGLLLSQLNRSSAKEARMPVLSDLRDSGSIEQDADIVLFPWWEAKQNPQASPFDYKIIQAKNRPRGVRMQMVDLVVDPYEQWLRPKEFESAADDWS